jgi:uncharacterized protein (DUF736 family)
MVACKLGCAPRKTLDAAHADEAREFAAQFDEDRVVAGDVELGAAWNEASKGGREYLRIRLDILSSPESSSRAELGRPPDPKPFGGATIVR